MLFEESVFIFQFMNNKMHNYVLFNTFVHFIIQKLKNKQNFIQTEKAKSSYFDRTRGDKNQIFPTLVLIPGVVNNPGHAGIFGGSVLANTYATAAKQNVKPGAIFLSGQQNYVIHHTQKSVSQSGYEGFKVRNIWPFSPLVLSNSEKNVLVLLS